MSRLSSFFVSILILLLVLSVTACPGPKPAPTGDGGTTTQGDTTSGQTTRPTTPSEVEKVTLATSDGQAIIGSFVGAQGASPAPACLLVHQLGADKSTFADFQQILSNAGIASLAIDMRGHGESTGGAELAHRGFSPDQWAAVTNDFFAGLDYLRTKDGVDASRLAVIGASIGANLAVVAVADEITQGKENSVKAMVLLSPGTRYHGIQPLPRARELGQIPVLIVSASSDSQSYPGSQSLSQAARNATLHEVEGQAHGTELLAEEGASDLLVEWLSTNFVNSFPTPTPPDASSGGQTPPASGN